MQKQLLIIIFIFIVSLTFSQKKSKETITQEQKFSFKYYFLEGAKQKNLGNYNLALGYYGEALKINEKDPATNFEIANILIANQDYFSAIQYIKNSVKNDKSNNKFYLSTLLSCQVNTGDINGVIDTYKNLIKTSDKTIYYYFDLANLYAKNQDFKNALKTLNEAEKKFGITEEISITKESIYFNQKNNKAAINEMIKLLKSNPTNNKYKALLAETYQNTGDMKSAQEYYSQIENSNSLDGYVCLSVANYYSATKNFGKFFEFLNKAFLDVSVDVSIKKNILFGIIDDVEFTQKYSSEIKNLIDVVIFENTDDLAIKAIYADFLINLQNYKAAQGIIEELLQNDKNKYQIWQQLLTIDYSIQDYQKLYEHGKEAVELFPNYLELYKFYVLAAFITQNYNDVATAVDYASMLAISDIPVLVDLLSMQGEAYYKLEKYSQSDSVFDLALSKDPENINILNNYSYYLSTRNEKIDKALSLSTKLISLSSTNPIYLDTHAWALYKNQQFEDALNYINKTILFDATKGIYYNHKGDILYKLNLKDDAVKMWEKAKYLNDTSSDIDKKIINKSIIE
ncbi:MAG: hypothetical protein LBV69_06080 [Bacteroidales bacterium]|jgi:tetratricopeptide (TPR) repeat protein|nr:hypothetical protein [Bacteroidales bacterium]